MDSLDDLLEKLSTGDDDAAGQVFIRYEPYLRKVVRRLLPAELRAKFDSIDVVQSVYGDVLGAFRQRGMRFSTAAQLRAFLIKATRNRFIDRLRQHRTAARLEQPFVETDPERIPSSPQPRPSEVAIAEELWQRLLALCPPEHHELLWLRRQGATTSEIAAQVGMHAGSVRRVLRDLSIRLACSQAVGSDGRVGQAGGNLGGSSQAGGGCVNTPLALPEHTSERRPTNSPACSAPPTSSRGSASEAGGS